MTSAEIYNAISSHQTVNNLRLANSCCVNTCLTETTNKKIICEEAKSNKLTINNPQQKLGQKIKVDACLFTDANKTGKCCDYLFFLYENSDSASNNEIISIHYIELKRSANQDAPKQLENIYKLLTPVLKKHCKVTCKKHFIITGKKGFPTIREEQDRLRKKYNIVLAKTNEIVI